MNTVKLMKFFLFLTLLSLSHGTNACTKDSEGEYRCIKKSGQYYLQRCGWNPATNNTEVGKFAWTSHDNWPASYEDSGEKCRAALLLLKEVECKNLD